MVKLILGRKILGHNKAKWGSTILMVERIVEQHPALKAMVHDPGTKINKKALETIESNLFTSSQITEIKKVIKALKPFVTATTDLCGDQYTTINEVSAIH